MVAYEVKVPCYPVVGHVIDGASRTEFTEKLDLRFAGAVQIGSPQFLTRCPEDGPCSNGEGQGRDRKLVRDFILNISKPCSIKDDQRNQESGAPWITGIRVLARRED